MALPDTISSPVRTLREWIFETTTPYENPLVDIRVTATFTSPTGISYAIEAFHDSETTWKVRFNPGAAGTWSYQVHSVPPDPDFLRQGKFNVTASDARGFLRSTPGEAWGFRFESGDPIFIFGDTVYHLFGMAHNSDEGKEEVRAFLTRRAAQGFNLLRIRVPVSAFHHPDGHNFWQTRSLWPWGGSEQMPRFDRINLAYFQTIDEIVQLCEDLDIGIEMIVEAWGNEFPFNSRQIFTAEWEELWFRYLIARYDAFNALWFWQLQNEYEYYPNGDWNYASSSKISDRWAIRVAHLVRSHAPHDHIVAIHNGPAMPSFGTRFKSDPKAIDTVMFKTWGTTGKDDAWLAAGIEDVIVKSLGDWTGSAVFAEWGYEFNPDLPRVMLGHEWCDVDHTRRGAWRGVFSGMGIIHGFENSWGPFQILDRDQPGLQDLLLVRRFVTEIVDFSTLHPAHDLVTSEGERPGHRPLALATPDRHVIAIYLPTGGDARVSVDVSTYASRWYNPRCGTLTDASVGSDGRISAPISDDDLHPADWVLLLTRR